MSIRKRLKNFINWCPQPPTRLPIKLRSYSVVPIASVLIAVLIFSILLYLPSLQRIPTQPMSQLPQILSENPSNSTPSPSPTETATPSLILTPAPTSTPTTAPPSLPIYTPTPGNLTNGILKFTLSVEKIVFSAGEPVNITFTISNISNQTVNLTSTAQNFDYNITDGHYIIYQLSLTQILPQIAVLTQLEPGQNVTENYIWPQISSTTPISDGIPVASGTYWITGKTNLSIGLLTDPLEITIESVV